ncbi:hypothetical protein HaLaN_15123 [Haematococcus lacustris]|uniref:Uncharacterized protein n=1 Tax=Haematococcus lacustris TaxID=44745 RepID=A0A699Z6T1_HAELA|nr:hypothetical protein HaLaN_15123 [Haematococcus lacustris]
MTLRHSDKPVGFSLSKRRHEQPPGLPEGFAKLHKVLTVHVWLENVGNLHVTAVAVQATQRALGSRQGTVQHVHEPIPRVVS